MTVRIAMWSGPRNLSTAMMRSWENRSDTVVLDEPLYAHYLAETGLDHPARDEIVAAGPTAPTDAIARCLAPLPPGIEVGYQKHMSHHLLPTLERDWLDELRHFLLIRDPLAVLASYTRVREAVTLDDIGLPQQLELLDRAELVIDADDFLADPRRYSEALCAHLGLAFTDAMLSWPAGPRSSDGPWAPHWYGSVWSSTSFRAPPDPGSRPDRHRLRADLSPPAAAVVDEAEDLYRQLHRHRLVW